jgi:hypothetical protein
MQTLVPVFVLILLAAAPAAADCTTTHIGSFTYYNDADGSSGSSMRIGQFEYYHQATPPRSERPRFEPLLPDRFDSPYRSRSWYEEEE